MAKGAKKSTLLLIGVSLILLRGDFVTPKSSDGQLDIQGTLSSPRPVDETQEIILSSNPLASSKDFPGEIEIRQLFKDAKFSEALRLSQDHLKNQDLPKSYRIWLEEQVPTIKLGLAWQWIRGGKCEDAVDLLNSLTQGMHVALAFKGLGYCFLKKKDYYTAQSNLQQYLTLKPNDPEAYILLAEAEEALGGFEVALELTQKANTLTQLRDEEKVDLEKRESKLVAKMDELPTQGEINSGFFTIRYQVRENQQFVQSSLSILQNHVLFLVQNLGFEFPQQTIEVIFHPRDNFAKASHGPVWAAGIFDGRIRIPVDENQTLDERFARILRHELTHAMLSEQARHQRLPDWFQEGLAQFCECENFCHSYRFAATQQKFLDIQIFEQDFSLLADREAGVAYRQSLYLLLTLTKSPYYFGFPGLKQIIQALPNLEHYRSNELMRQIGSDFSQLHAHSSQYWNEQKSY